MADYDLLKIIDDMELDFIDRIRRHEQKYIELGMEDWKTMQLREMKRFELEIKEMLGPYYEAFEEGQEIDLKRTYMEAKKKEAKRLGADLDIDHTKDHDPRGRFHSIDDARMISMIQATRKDYEDAIYSLYRQSDDIYRKLIFRASAMVNSGGYDLVSAINAANKTFLANGVQSVPYKSKETGKIIRYVNARSYCEMALRTNGHRAALSGQGMVRDELYENPMVRISHHQSSCPLCGPWQGKILIDDVYASGTPDGIHGLLSDAMREGLFHPNCRHSAPSYDPDVDDDYGDVEYTEEDKARYKAEQKQRAIERDIRKAKREVTATVDGNKKVQRLQEKLRKHLDDNPLLRRKPWRESDNAGGQYMPPETPDKPKKQPAKQAKTPEEAKKLLTEEIGFTKIDDTLLRRMDPQIMTQITNQLLQLENKFGMIKDTGTIGLDWKAKGKTTMAFVSSRIINPTLQDLTYTPGNFGKGKKESLIAETKTAIESKHFMPCKDSDETYARYTTAHEYGHIIQNVIAKKYMEEKGYEFKENFITWTELAGAQAEAKRYRQKVQIDCYNDIINIAKEKNPDFKLEDNISKYGATNEAEFFAECFANSQLGAPNELGDAMNIYLERKGLIK